MLRPAGSADAAMWSSLNLARVPLASAGMLVFETGEAVDALYLVGAGCIRTFTVDQDGNERVRGFHFPGDLIGLDALYTDRHPSSAVAVTASHVCRIPRRQLQRLALSMPGVARALLERASADLALALALSGDYSAEQRLAAFLMLMQDRIGAQPGSAASSITLPMTRRDIANYLRLATETVCRVLTRFEQQRLVEVIDKTVQVLVPARLRQLAQPVGICNPLAQTRMAA
jgi:CRP/FNR family transcriptional regulator